MNRTIKFRGKRVDNGEWVYGYYFVDEFFHSSEAHRIFTNRHEKISVLPETVGQFTGLHDKNGKEIYEGDHFGNKSFPVTFNYGQFLLGGVPLIGYFNGNYMTQLEAITGNIHDND